MKRRFSALICAFVLLASLIAFPLRARAAASAAVAVSAGVVVTAALMASGIYPYEEQKQFADYVSGNLAELWGDYVEWRENNIINFPDEEPPTPFDDVTGLIVSGSLVVSRKIWNALSDFGSWVVQKFSLVDNWTGVHLGGDFCELPVGSWNFPTLYADGFVLPSNFDSPVNYYIGATKSGVYSSAVPSRTYSNGYYFDVYLWTLLPGSAKGVVKFARYPDDKFVNSGDFVNWIYSPPYSVAYKDMQVRISRLSEVHDVVFFSSMDEMKAAVSDFVSNGVAPYDYDLTVDTMEISLPEFLPDNESYVAFSIPGIDSESTVSDLESIVETAVEEREKPVITLELVPNPDTGQSTEPNPDTGESTNPNPDTGESTNPDTGESTNPNPDTGQSTNPNPDTGESTNPNPDTGESTNPDTGESTNPNPDTGESTNPNPDTGESTNPDTGESTNPNPDTGESTNPNPDTGESTNPNPDTGETETLEISDYQIPGLSEVFPFSIPWDIVRIYQAFNAAPVSPTEFHLSFDFPILSSEPVEIDVALPENAREAFDKVAGVVRAFTLTIACIAYTVWIGKYIRW